MASEFFSKIVGVSSGGDPIGRQLAVSRLRSGQQLTLRREPRNPHDLNAIAVWVTLKRFIFLDYTIQLGYLTSDVAHEWAEEIDQGADVRCYVAQVTGGSQGKKYGCNVRIVAN